MGRKPIIAGNWKSNPKSPQAIKDLAAAFNAVDFDPMTLDVVVCPTNVHLALARSEFKSEIYVGAQNVNNKGEGAYTGHVTAAMIKELGFEWTIIGHSETRHGDGDSNEKIAEKLKMAQEEGLKVMFCIGELLTEREAGKTIDVIREQLLAAIPSVKDWSRIVIAYEPVWAIGTGVVATPAQADEAHGWVRQVLAENVSKEVADSTRIQYGGSVNPENCKELIALPNVDGFLVGGAALKPTFTEVIKSAM